MDDAFWGQFREQPRPEFAQAVQSRFSRPSPKPGAFKARIKRLGVGIACALAVGSAAFAASPALRAQVRDAVYTIAGFTLHSETNIGTGWIESPAPELTELGELERKIGQKIKVPTYIPIENAQLTGPSVIYEGPLWRVGFTWGKPDHFVEYALFSAGSWADQYTVGPAEIKQVSINGHPGVLSKGVWVPEFDAAGKPTGRTKPSTDKILSWHEDGHHVMANSSGNVSDEDLIKFAESAR